MRRVLGGGQSWWLSMGWIGGVGAKGKSLVLMAWVFRNSFVRGGRHLGTISVLILARAPRFAFRMMLGVGIEPLKRLFLVCLSLPVPRRRPLRIMWSGQMVFYNGISSFLG